MPTPAGPRTRSAKPTKRPTKRQTTKTSPNGTDSKKALTYADSGVDIDAGDRFVGAIMGLMRRTHGPRVLRNDGGFAGLFRLDFNEKLFKRNYKEPVLVAATDGVGTKLKLARDMDTFDTVGQDLVAMCVNDLIVEAAEPLFFLDYLAIPKVEHQMLVDLVKGVSKGCELAGCSLLGGETAELPGIYPEGEFDMAGFAVGVVELRRATSSMKVEPGDVVLGLASSGVHSNGFSLVRRVIDHANLDLHTVYPELDAEQSLGQVLLTPTRIYANSITRILRGYKVKRVVSGMAHITGGGLAGNLERSLHPGVDAVLDRKAWPVPPIFNFLKKHGNIRAPEMDKVFNMGVGYCVIVRPTFADAIADKLARLGEGVTRIGVIRKGEGRVLFRS
ncbi:MAG: phosphoribosylformylglycinamidine cyclo-ligase [Phycisphaera sp.]|nr:MAG: phosphoribosylformylglycinamidine cyclo-ligase [Phycisphaera sp.]